MIEVPILNAAPPDTGQSPTLTFADLRYGLLFGFADDSCIFQFVMPDTYQEGSVRFSIGFYSSAGSLSHTFGVSFQKLPEGSDLTSFSFGTQKTGTKLTTASGTYYILTIDLDVDDLDNITPNTLCRVKLKLVTSTGTPIVTNIVLTNVP